MSHGIDKTKLIIDFKTQWLRYIFIPAAAGAAFLCVSRQEVTQTDTLRAQSISGRQGLLAPVPPPPRDRWDSGERHHAAGTPADHSPAHGAVCLHPRHHRPAFWRYTFLQAHHIVSTFLVTLRYINIDSKLCACKVVVVLF